MSDNVEVANAPVVFVPAVPVPISDNAEKICELISLGLSVSKACREVKISEHTFYGEMVRNQSLEQQYARAREYRADSRFESVDNIVERLLDGELDPNAARSAIDAIKWQCGKEKAKVYGERKSIDTTVTIQQVDATIAALERQLSDVIDVESSREE